MAGRARFDPREELLWIIGDGFDPREEFLYKTGVSVPKNVVRAKIHPDVKFIPDELFAWCCYLESVTFHAGLEGIGKSAFEGCGKLRTFRCPHLVRKIGKDAFRWCSRLAEVELAQCLEEIEEATFCGCSSLQVIRIPSSVTKIGANAFQHCTGLASADLPEGLRTMGDWVFGDCSSLGSVLVPRTVESIGSWAFIDCENLSFVQIHEDLEEIGMRVFSGCPSVNVRFVPLSTRREAIPMDARARSMFEDKLNEITTGAMTKWNFNWVECKESLGQAHAVIDHWEELNEAATTLELAQWKNKIQEVEGEGCANRIDNNPGRQNLDVKKRGQKRRLDSASEERQVPRGAGTVTKEVLKFLAHSKTWE